MKILNKAQIQAADHYTIANEPISSLDLMERAAEKCFEWIEKSYHKQDFFILICGTGNNGGDGLALARMMYHSGYHIRCFELPLSKESIDYQSNKQRLPLPLCVLETKDDFPEWDKEKTPILIDALLGSGLNKPVVGSVFEIIQKINLSGLEIISIDIPSGVSGDFNDTNPSNGGICATHTLSFQFPKMAFLLPERGNHIGTFHILDIGLHPEFINKMTVPFTFTTRKDLLPLIKQPKKFDHKGTFGQLLLIAGSEGKMGAAILAAKAALHSGVGKLTIHSPKCGLKILQTSVIEAMVELNKGEKQLKGTFKGDYKIIAIGPGIGTGAATASFLETVIMHIQHPIILDADALNILAKSSKLWKHLPEQSILTPHPKEFERLVGPWKSDREKLDKLMDLCAVQKCICILKGAHTAICFPNKSIAFNSSGNSGMATAGSGDVLTGILGSLLAQGYSPENTAIIGVYLHGLAGDFANNKWGKQAMTAGSIQNTLAAAFREILS